MATRRPTLRPRDRHSIPAWIAPAAALVVGLILAGASATASASSLSAVGRPAAGGREHHHACKCGMHCETACCCAADEPQAPPPPLARRAPTPSTPAPTDGAGPCLRPMPCGDAALPTATMVDRAGPSAALATAAPPRPATAGALIAIPPEVDAPSAVPDRIDKPPEPGPRA